MLFQEVIGGGMMIFHSPNCPKLGRPVLSLPYSMDIRIGRNWYSLYEDQVADRQVYSV